MFFFILASRGGPDHIAGCGWMWLAISCQPCPCMLMFLPSSLSFGLACSLELPVLLLYTMKLCPEGHLDIDDIMATAWCHPHSMYHHHPGQTMLNELPRTRLLYYGEGEPDTIFITCWMWLTISGQLCPSTTAINTGWKWSSNLAYYT